MTNPPRFRRYDAETRARMLVEAGLACLAQGGITAFTIDNICARAQASRGLVAHHFGSKDGLLAAVYAAAYRPMMAATAPANEPPLPLATLIDRIFSAEKFTRENLNIWLAIWGETAANPGFSPNTVSSTPPTVQPSPPPLPRSPPNATVTVDAETLATSIIALADGYWLEQCLDPDRIAPDAARAACVALLEPLLGPLT